MIVKITNLTLPMNLLNMHYLIPKKSLSGLIFAR